MDGSLALDFTRFTALRAGARDEPQRTAGRAAREFETLFIQQMLRVMRDSLPQDGPFSSSSMRMYQDWFDQQVAQEMGRRGALGLAEVVERQLLGGTGPSPAGRTVPATEAWLALRAARPPQRLEPVDEMPPQPPPARVNDDGKPDRWRESPAQFVRQLLPHARRAAAALGVHPGLLLAQAALETGWGRYLPRDEAGREALNLFGIKAGPGWKGETVLSDTREVRQGRWQRERAGFRGFSDLGAAFDGLVDFLRSNPRYERALAAASDPLAWARELQRAGYATDPNYARKLLDIFNRPEFRRWLQQAGGGDLKFSGSAPITSDEPAL